MAGVSLPELVLLFVIGLLILGPERLPRVASQIGRWVGRARRTANQLRYQLEREIALADLEKPSKQKEPKKTKGTDDSRGTDEPKDADDAENGEDSGDSDGNDGSEEFAPVKSSDAKPAEPDSATPAEPAANADQGSEPAKDREESDREESERA